MLHGQPIAELKKSQAKEITLPSQASESELVWLQDVLYMVEDLLAPRIPRLWEEFEVKLYALVLDGLPCLIKYNKALRDFLHWDVGLYEILNALVLTHRLVFLKLVTFYPFENHMQELLFCHFFNLILKLS